MPLRVVLDAIQRPKQHGPHVELIITACIDELAESLDEQLDAVGFEPLMGQRMPFWLTEFLSGGRDAGGRRVEAGLVIPPRAVWATAP
jgi:hypothetical protein